MQGFITEYIKHRMKERQIEKYHIKPHVLMTTFSDTPSRYDIQAYNEYYYLVSKQLDDGSVIFSDTNYYHVNRYNDLECAKAQEFTGQINIYVPASMPVQIFEFLRVIPE